MSPSCQKLEKISHLSSSYCTFCKNITLITFAYCTITLYHVIVAPCSYYRPLETKNTAFRLPPVRGELSYLVPLSSENISAPYFKQCFFQGGEVLPPQTVKHHASQSQDRNNKYFILYIEFCINNKI